MASADPVPDHRSHVMSLVERVQIDDFSPLTQIIWTLVIFAGAWGLRVLVDPALPPGFPYVTFFPAVILTSFLFGLRAGMLSAVLCGLVAWYYFVAPARSFQIAGAEVALGFYIFVVGTDLALIHRMRVANRQLREQREKSLELAAEKQTAVAELEARADELRKALDELRESEVKTHIATQTAGIGIWQWHVPTGRVYWDDTMLALYGMARSPDGSFAYEDYLARVHPDDVAEQKRILTDTVKSRTGSIREFRIRRGDDGRIRHLRAVEVAREDAAGRTEWVVGTNLDITDEKDRESHIRLLLGEVNHRAKNLLAVVLSVARKTSGTDHETFMANFAARIQSLAASQDLLVRSAWRGVGLEALVAAQLGHFKDLIGTRIVLSGEDIALTAPAVQAFGMALHELVTNASKHGALSQDGGIVTLGWTCEGEGEDARFVMHWTESGGPPVTPPTQSGFGWVVVGDMVRNSLDAEVDIRFAREGFAWRMDCALTGIIERDELAADLR